MLRLWVCDVSEGSYRTLIASRLARLVLIYLEFGIELCDSSSAEADVMAIFRHIFIKKFLCSGKSMVDVQRGNFPSTSRWCGIFVRSNTSREISCSPNVLFGSSCNVHVLKNSQWPPKVTTTFANFYMLLQYEFVNCSFFHGPESEIETQKTSEKAVSTEAQFESQAGLFLKILLVWNNILLDIQTACSSIKRTWSLSVVKKTSR